MTAENFDYLIVGRGLAGTTLAWHLRWAGQRVAIIDREAALTSSRIAAGLMTPITGKRLAKSWRYEELFPVAVMFYERVEVETGSRFFTRRPILRLFRNERERAVYAERAENVREFVSPVEPTVDDRWFAAPLGGFEMTATGQLAVARYLDASRPYFACRVGKIQESDIELRPDGVCIPRLGLMAQRIIFCQGIEATNNSWFRQVRFNPAKGDILTLRIPGLSEPRVVNRGVWLAPVDDGTYRAGSTYDLKSINDTPTPQGSEQVCNQLREFLRMPFEVISHTAAVRPIVEGRRPILGLHPTDQRLGFFNGLGSKGTLLAPYFSAQFAQMLTGGPPLDPEVDLSRIPGPN